ncbi:glycosyltransferase family 61 protein [Methylorubrum suomiense]|nr:glycosyltransferase family 61 protein [Methylorubrum suomiense]
MLRILHVSLGRAVPAEAAPEAKMTTRIPAPGFPNAYLCNYDAHQIERDLSCAEIMPQGVEPELMTFNDVWMYPGFSSLYQDNGERIPGTESRYFRPNTPVRPADIERSAVANDGNSPLLVDPSALRKFYGGFLTIDRPILYFGMYTRHYGHFLTDSMSRLWANRSLPSDLMRVFLPHGSPDRAKIPFIKFINEKLNLGSLPPEITSYPVRFRKVVVPEPAFQTRYRIFDNADTPHLDVTHAVDHADEQTRPVYLSRSRLQQRLRDISDEDQVEAIFRSRGFQVIYPEMLTLSDQIKIFNTAPILAGFIGSAFHTALFSRRSYSGQMILIAGNEVLSARFLLIGAIKGFTTDYVKAGRYSSSSGKREVIPDVDAIKSYLESKF